MNRIEVIEIAKLAGFSYDPITAHVVAVDGYTEVTVTPGIERFALEVERRTLERAAAICETQWATEEEMVCGVMFADAIRALGEK